MERHPARFILAALFIVFLSLSESYHITLLSAINLSCPPS